MSDSFEKHIVIEVSGQTAIAVLSENCPQISKQKLKQAMQYGALWLTHLGKTVRVRRAKKVLNVGDELHLYYNESTLFSEIKPAILIADEKEYSVWNKPCGMFSQGTKWGDHTSIARWVELFGLAENELPIRPCFLVHRLDRATNGLIVVAHSKKTASRLAGLFEERKIIKRYSACVAGKFVLTKSNTRLTSKIDDKEAKTVILSAAHDEKENQTVLLISIETGRKHQIRKHLSEIGFPIIGDRLYGGRLSGNHKPNGESEAVDDLKLRACFLELESPDNEQSKAYQLASY